ncbi:MAG: low molecular weight protein-tyrosine-phosphatase [Pseudomonadota bacterium]
MEKTRVIFVCMGNICRSPTAHGVFRAIVEAEGLDHLVAIDSAGTHAYHVGEGPDRRAQSTARGRGIDISDLRARQVVPEDFQDYDYVLAMDADNLEVLAAACPEGMEHKVRLFMDFAPDWGVREVPDPYYGGASGFQSVFDMVEAASRGLLEEIRNARD